MNDVLDQPNSELQYLGSSIILFLNSSNSEKMGGQREVIKNLI